MVAAFWRSRSSSSKPPSSFSTVRLLATPPIHDPSISGPHCPLRPGFYDGQMICKVEKMLTVCPLAADLLTPEQRAQQTHKQPPPFWERRRVDAALRITYQGWHWSVVDLPGVCVGDLVQCRLTRRGAFLRIRADREAPSSILASRLEPAHSHPHTPAPVGIEVSSGTATTSHAPGPRHPCPGEHAPRTPRKPPAAKHEARRRSRSAGTAGAAPAVCSISIELAAALEQDQPPRPRTKDRNRPRVSLRISVSRC